MNFNFDIIFSFLSEGRKHDAGMLADSGLMQDLESYAFSTTGDPMELYSDPAYPLKVHLIVPYCAAGISPQMEEFNKCMITGRLSVEWLWDIIDFFKFVDFSENLKDIIECSGKDVERMCNFKKCHDLFVRKFHFWVLGIWPTYPSGLFFLTLYTTCKEKWNFND